MKKMYVVLLSVVICLSCFCFVGCGDKEQAPIDNSANKHVGDQIATYPDCDFNYKCYKTDGSNFVVHISKFSVTLTEINAINPGDTVEGVIYPCAYDIIVVGSADSSLSGTTLTISFRCGYGSTLMSKIIANATIQENGSIQWELQWQATEIDKVYLIDINVA